MKKSAKKKVVASKRIKTKSSTVPAGAEQDIVGLLTMLVQKLTSFEAKIDMVLSRIPAQPIAVPNVPKQQQQPVIASLPKPVRENRHMHKAICADCGMDCEVPFKPREDRQVYCKECFAKRKSNKSIFKPQVLDKPKQEIPVTINAAPAEKPKAAKPAESPKKPFKKKKKTNR